MGEGERAGAREGKGGCHADMSLFFEIISRTTMSVSFIPTHHEPSLAPIVHLLKARQAAIDMSDRVGKLVLHSSFTA